MTTKDTVDAFLDKLTALGDRLVDTVEPTTKVAVDATLTAVHFNGIVWITTACFALAALSCAALSMRWLLRHWPERFDDEPHYIVGSIISSAVMVVSGLAVVAIAGSPSVWMALFRPDAYLAAQALGL